MFEVGDIIECIHDNGVYPKGITTVVKVTHIHGKPAIIAANSQFAAFAYRYVLLNRPGYKEITEEDLLSLV